RRARTDPSETAALWEGLDLRGRCALVRAIAGAGTRASAEVALRLASDPEAEVFRALLAGLVEGGERALAAPIPDNILGSRRKAIQRLRLRWRLEAELARLKSPSGPTGSYVGQFDAVKALGRDVVPLLLDIVADRDPPLPDEGASGPYEPIHPEMALFESEELRQLVAGNLGQVIPREDEREVRRVHALWERYWELDDEEHPFEREDLAPALAFSLHDLGIPRPAEQWVGHLLRKLDSPRRTVEPLWELGYAMIRLGRYDEGEGFYQRLLQSTNADNRALAAYNLACSFAQRAAQDRANRRTHVENAMRYLRLAVSTYKFVEWQWMEQDRDLDPLRDDPRFRTMLAQLRAEWPDRRSRAPKKDMREILGEEAASGD
ncbi:MAG: TPR end-of-group domain-containing protein, partial [Planctomycetota bacterium]